MTEPESPSVTAMRAELGKHADVERIVCRVPGHTVPAWCVFNALRGEVPTVAARLVSAMRADGWVATRLYRVRGGGK